MNDQTSESARIVELARQRVAERKAAAGAQRVQRETPWRYAFLGLAGALLLGLLAWPGTPLNWKMYAVVHGVCAQIHNVQLGGMQLPICARNTGIYSSFLLTSLFLLALGRARAAKLPPLPITITLAAFVVLMALDGINSTLVDLFLPHFYTPRNELRTLTGIGMGVAIAVFLFLILNVALRRNADHAQPVIGRWWELGAALLLNLLVLAAMYGNVGFMYWPIAFTAWAGIIGVLYLVNVLLAALAMGYEGAVTRAVELARPATVAILLTLVELGAMSWGRFWLESQGLVFGA
jgi:uncharacterized membrane protein